MKKLLPAILLFLAFQNCEEVHEVPLTEDESEIIGFFNVIALGFKYSEADPLTRKWTTPIQVYIHGDPSQELLDEFDAIVAEIEGLATDGLDISIVTNESTANYHLYFTGHDVFAEEFPVVASLVEEDWGLYVVDWNNDEDIFWGAMYVDVVRNTDLTLQRHWLREEFTQSLGLGNDSELYPNSIFRQSWSNSTAFTDLDRDLIRLLYHPNMTSGLNESEATQVLGDILFQER